MVNKKILLFVPYGHWMVHNQFDAVIGSALKLRGAEVLAACCDGIFENCPIAAKENRKASCKSCYDSIKQFFKPFQIPIVSLGSMLSKEDRQEARKWVDDYAPEMLPSAVRNNAEIGRWVSPGIHSRMTTSSHDLSDPEVERIYRDYVYNGVLIERGLGQIFERFKPDHMICFSGMHAYHRVAFMLARQRGIRTLVHERGYIDDSFSLVDNDTIVMRNSRTKSWEAWKDIPLNIQELEWVRGYMKDRECGRNMNTHSPYRCSTDAAMIRKTLRIPSDRKIVAIFPMSDWEYGIGKYDREQTFESQIEGMQKIISSLPPDKYTIVIRLHPPMGFSHLNYGRRFMEQMFKFSLTLPEHVRLISPLEELTSYALLWVADATVTFGSTVGLEALFKGGGSVSTTCNMFSPAVDWVQSSDHFDMVIKSLIERTKNYDVNDLRLAYRATYHLFKRVNFNFTSFGIRDRHLPDIRIQSIQQLIEGNDAALDHVCNHILHQHPLFALPTADDRDKNEQVEQEFLQNELEAIKEMRSQIALKSSRNESNEALVTIVRCRQNGIQDDADTYFASSAGRVRYGNIERERVFELSLPSGYSLESLRQEMAAAVSQAKGKYIYFGVDHIQMDEAWISTAVDFLENEENKDVDGVLSGAWICDANGRAYGELFTKAKPETNYKLACEIFPPIEDPVKFLGFILCRKSAWQKISEHLSKATEDLESVSELMFNYLFGEDAIIKLHPLGIPLLTAHIPRSGQKLMEKGVEIGSKGQWDAALKYLGRSADTGFEAPELNFWRSAALARVGRPWEAAILSADLRHRSTLTDERLRIISDRLSSEVDMNKMQFTNIASSIDEIEGYLVEGQEKYLFDKVKSLPDGATVLEIGSCRGRSTASMAYACCGSSKRIFAIDTFLGIKDGGSITIGNSFYDIWKRNIHRRGLQKYVTALQGTSHEQLVKWDSNVRIDFVFIDASHLYEDVIKDLELVYPLVKEGGWIALHDVDPSWPGVWRVWRETAAPLLDSHEYSTTLACGRKQAGKPIILPDSDRFDYSRQWTDHMRTLVPQLADAMDKTLNPATYSDPQVLSVAENIIAAMPDHPLLRSALREMLKLEADCDPYLHYWNALTYLHDNENESAINALRQALKKEATSGLRNRIEQLLSNLGVAEPTSGIELPRKEVQVDALRIVFVNTYYPKFIQHHYKDNPELKNASYAEQLSSLVEQHFGDSDFYSRGMQQAGWSAHDLIVNCDPLQRAWASENRFEGQGLAIAVEQIRRLQPQVIYLQDLSLATPEFISSIKAHTQLVVGQIASPLPSNTDLKRLDIIFSSFPHFVERFRKSGITAYYQPLAFEPRVLKGLEEQERIHDVTFVGGLSPAHGKGLEVLQQVTGMVPVEFWGYGADCLPADSPIRSRHHGEVWGHDMFKILAQSRITLNRHIDVAENYANNMRLFEATGCGALLITDYQDNLNDLFEIGKEIVAYRSPEECAALVRYYQANPQEAEEIARNGQQRTLREHSYAGRMKQTAEILNRHLRYNHQTFAEPDLNAISCGHQNIQADDVTAQMTHAWQDESIPDKQRALVHQELLTMYRGAPPLVYQVMAEALRSITGNGDSILEIGCASGYYYEVIEYLLNRRITYTGVDYSDALVTMARDYYDRPAFHVADGACLPFMSGEFDVAISSGILLHVPNYDEHIAETVRVARRYVVAHRTPVCRQQPTQYMKKQAYGVETVELRFNEKEILDLFLAQGLKLKGGIEYSAEPTVDRYEMTYIFEKMDISASTVGLTRQQCAHPPVYAES